MADVTPHSTAPLVWEVGGRTFRAVEDVLPDLADWPTHQPDCCQTACPATVNGHDPAGCALRLTGTCAGCRCRRPRSGSPERTTVTSCSSRRRDRY